MSRLPWSVRLGLWLYRWLLLCYPPAFRQQFGAELAQVVQDCSRDAYRQHGLVGLAWVWVGLVLDLGQSAWREWKLGNALWRGCAVVVGLGALALWIGSLFDSIGLFGLGHHMSLRFTQGVAEFRCLDTADVGPPVPAQDWHAMAAARGWFRPEEPDFPGFAYSSGHVLGIASGNAGSPVVCPVEYELWRVPLWVFLLPWLISALRRSGQQPGRVSMEVQP